MDPNVLANLDTWINNVQEPNGGSMYNPCWGPDGGNILRTGNLLYEMALVGRPLADPTVQAAIGFIENNWPNWMGDAQGTFTMMKGLEAYQIDTLIVGAMDIDWFDEVSTFIVNDQNPDGSWPPNWGLHLDTPWNLLTLEKVVPPPQFDVEPDSASNYAGEDHTVTATVSDVLGNPLPGVPVTFEVISGPNAGAAGICTVNADCTTDANGQVSFTYNGAGGPGIDQIEACGVDRCEVVTKEWTPPPNTPPEAFCTESVNPAGKKIPPAGSTTLPGPKGGQNEDGFYELSSIDAEDGTADLYVSNASGSAVFGPFPSGAVVKITEDPDETPIAKPMGGPNSAVAAHIILDSDAVVFAVDSFGAVSDPVGCLVPPLPK